MEVLDEYSYAVGLWIGDGGKNGNIYSLSLSDELQAHNVKKILKGLFKEDNIKLKLIDNYCQLSILKSQNFMRELKKDLISGDLWSKIRNNPFPFIGGFIDSDGCVLIPDKNNDSNGLSIQISNTNIDWLRITQKLLRDNNLFSTIDKVPFRKINKNNEIWVVDRWINIDKLKSQYLLNVKRKPSTYILCKKIQTFITQEYAQARINTFIKNYEKLRMNSKIPIIEIFCSIQGEGSLTGTPQIFCRVSGCNLGCIDCDTKESWKRNDKLKITVREVIEKIKSFNCKSVCLTGGEITLYPYNIGFISAYLKSEGYYVNVQTNGIKFGQSIFDVVDKVCMDIKVASNKSFIGKLRPNIDEIKVLVGNKKDLRYARMIHKIAYKNNIKTILQVRNDVGNDNYKDLVEKYEWLSNEILNDTYKWNNIKVLPQLHVLIWGNSKGV